MSRSIKEKVLSVAVAGNDIKQAAIKATDSQLIAPKPKHVESTLRQASIVVCATPLTPGRVRIDE